MRLHGQKSGGAGWRLAPRGLSLALVLGAIFLAVALFPKWGVGQGCGEWVNVEVNPPNPTSNDFVTLILSGVWCDTCVPKSPTVSIVGHTITVYTTNKDRACFAVVTPWELRVSLGKLSPGRYSVLVIHNGRPIGGLELFEVRAAGPDFLIETMRWDPQKPHVGDQYVNFEVMVVNVGGARAYLSGVVLEVYKVKAGQRIAVARYSWTSGTLGPNETIVVKFQSFPYSPLTRGGRNVPSSGLYGRHGQGPGDGRDEQLPRAADHRGGSSGAAFGDRRVHHPPALFPPRRPCDLPR